MPFPCVSGLMYHIDGFCLSFPRLGIVRFHLNGSRNNFIERTREQAAKLLRISRS